TANACGCTVGTVKSRVSRGRATLNRLVAQGDAAPCPSMSRPALSRQGAQSSKPPDQVMLSG
ncbi:hypothetical protein V8352_21290, partial [Roseovarius sp. D0-M9]